jgi:ribonucleoside-diphosphate reductase alpha chain
MGYADLLVRIGVPYNSNDAIEVGRMLMRFIDEECKRESERLAEKRGVFPEWERSIWGPDATCARDADGERIRLMRRLRNCNATTVAPTGTISIFADCSGGIEPLFAVAFMRNQAGVLMPDVNKDFVRTAKSGSWYSDDLMRRIAEEGHIHFDEVPEQVQRVFVTAHDVTPEWHIRTQAAFQEHVDSAISKTCNFPREASEQHVRDIYVMAYDLDCKGVTVYRDASRPQQVLSTGKTAKEVSSTQQANAIAAATADLEVQLADARERVHAMAHEIEDLRGKLKEAEAGLARRRLKRPRPSALHGMTRRMPSPLGDIYVTVNEDEQGRPFEVFGTLGKAGGAAMADVEAIGRLISLGLRSGIPLKEIHRQVRGISSDRVVGLGPHKVLSVPDAIGIAIERWMQEKQGVQQDLLAGAGGAPVVPVREMVAGPEGEATLRAGGFEQDFIGACPDCGSQLAFIEGCAKCHVCGYSECG